MRRGEFARLSTLAQRPPQGGGDGFQQIIQHGALAGLDEQFRAHAGLEVHAVASPRQGVGIDRDLGDVVLGAGARIA